jgi:uncharacterized protein YjiS (DUF1127 family)
MRPCPKKCAALPLDAGKTIAMLVRAIWQIVGSRKELARLADLDDRMLADIGLTRSDLHIARRASLAGPNKYSQATGQAAMDERASV